MVSRLARTFLITTAIAAVVSASSLPARADDSAAAEALFQQAKTLTEAQKWAEACPKFAASYKLDKTLGTLLNLADCEEHVDKIASAWAHWGEAVEMAQKTGDKRADFATKRRGEITPKLPMIRLDVTAGKSALTVHRDGEKIDPAAFGVPLPSDPGSHTITVRRGDETLSTTTVTAKQSDTARVVLDLEAIEHAAPPPPVLVPVSGTQRKVGFAVLGVGAAAVIAAGGIEIGALVAKSSAGDPGACFNQICSPAGIDSIHKARTLANAGQWLGIGGLLVTAVGVTLVVTSPSGASRPAAKQSGGLPSSLSWSPWIGPGGAGLAVGGAL
ncbi:Hypothetical protein A7982_03516 [Minicystis rosea]|nr:Hypothetical protein A7982_03516 [Minicystis rosea]